MSDEPEPRYDLATGTWDKVCPCILAEQQDPDCPWHGREAQLESFRWVENHESLVKLLEDLAEYAEYLWQQNSFARTRSVSAGIQDRIRQAFERLELKQ